MDNVVKLDIDTRLDISAADMLRAIADEDPDNVFLVVWPNSEEMPTFHSSTSDEPVILMRLNQFIHDYYSGKFISGEAHERCGRIYGKAAKAD